MTKIIGRPVCGSTTIAVERIVSDGQPLGHVCPPSVVLPLWLSPSAVPLRKPAVGEEVDTWMDGQTCYAMGVKI